MMYIGFFLNKMVPRVIFFKGIFQRPSCKKWMVSSMTIVVYMDYFAGLGDNHMLWIDSTCLMRKLIVNIDFDNLYFLILNLCWYQVIICYTKIILYKTGIQVWYFCYGNIEDKNRTGNWISSHGSLLRLGRKMTAKYQEFPGPPFTSELGHR